MHCTWCNSHLTAQLLLARRELLFVKGNPPFCYLSSCDTPNTLSCSQLAWLVQQQERQKASQSLESGLQTDAAKTRKLKTGTFLLSIRPTFVLFLWTSYMQTQVRIPTNSRFSILLLRSGAVSPPHTLPSRIKIFRITKIIIIQSSWGISGISSNKHANQAEHQVAKCVCPLSLLSPM